MHKSNHDTIMHGNAANIQTARKKLPIYAHKSNIKQCISDNRVTIIVGETGSGKTTQVPQYLLELAGNARVAITQPRRVAAITVAQRVCEEINVDPLGETVGYCVRFDDLSSSKTLLRFVTDGMLVREALISPSLDKYSVVILDEAHERTLQTDILFGIIKRALRTRKDLRLVIMSATLETDLYQQFFTQQGMKPAIMRIPGRQYPVDVLYTMKTLPDYLDAALVAILQVHLDEQSNEGSILVFLTGQEDIETLQTLLEKYGESLPPTALKLVPCPIFAAMPREHQMKVFEPAAKGMRKVILATNIAETSITISGVRFVIDTGLVKHRSYVPQTGLELLQIEPISKAQAWQRTGRAGREAAGVCYRLFPESVFENLPNRSIPDIQRVSLESVVLQLKCMGVQDILTFEFLEKPKVASLLKAMEKLYALEAFDSDGTLTRRGRLMAGLPVEPMFAVMLLKATELGCAEEALSIVSMQSIDSIFYLPRDKLEQAAQSRAKFVSQEGDHIILLNVYKGYIECNQKQREKWCRDHFINFRGMRRVESVRDQLKSYLQKLKLPIISCKSNTEALRKSIVAGFFLNTAVLSSGQCKNSRNLYKPILHESELVKIHPSSILSQKQSLPQYVVFTELVFTSKHYIRSVLAIEKEWLVEIAPKFFRTSNKS